MQIHGKKSHFRYGNALKIFLLRPLQQSANLKDVSGEPGSVMLTRYYLFVLFAIIMTSCTGPRIVSSPSKTPALCYPSKRIPPKGAVPATQRPYKINGKTYYPLPSSHGYSERGLASWYGHDFHGKKTSNGEIYNMYAKTAAHKTLPMNTMLLVKNMENGRETVVRINDRGPFVKGRIIDLTLTAAKKLNIIKKGTARVRITALGEAAVYRHDGKTMKRFLPHKDFEAGEFYVQIGSFTNRNNAEKLKKRMLRWGKKTILQTVMQDSTVFHRIQVRAGKNIKTARRMERVLSEAGFPGAFVIAR